MLDADSQMPLVSRVKRSAASSLNHFVGNGAWLSRDLATVIGGAVTGREVADIEQGAQQIGLGKDRLRYQQSRSLVIWPFE